MGRQVPEQPQLGSTVAAPESTVSLEQISLFQPIEVTWKAPGSKIDSYVLHYGTRADALDRSITVEIKDIEHQTVPGRGLIERYILKDESLEGRTVFLTLSAVVDGETSAPSEIIEVAPKPIVK